MKKPYRRDDNWWIVPTDDYSNGRLFTDAKDAWDFYCRSLASDESDDYKMDPWYEENESL
jgi:hypothetical protein